MIGKPLFRSSNRPLTLLKVGVFETGNPAIFGLHGKGSKGRIRVRKNAMSARGRRRVFILLLLARFFFRLRAVVFLFLEPSAVSGKVKLCKLMVKRRGDWGFRPHSSRLRLVYLLTLFSRCIVTQKQNKRLLAVYFQYNWTLSFPRAFPCK